jgi:hypothetical protein
LDCKQRLIVFQTHGRKFPTTCSFNPPIKEQEMIAFEGRIGCKLPEDYRFFLTIHNGAKIFQLLLENKNIGGGLELFSVMEIMENLEYLVYLDEGTSLLPVGYLEQQFLAINLEELKRDNPNIYF